MRFIFTILLSLFFLCAAFTSVPSSIWNTLSKLKFDIQFDEELDEVIFVPKLGSVIKKLAGETIIIEGYPSQLEFDYLPTDLDKQSFVMCRYEREEMGCSMLGVESYIEIKCNHKIKPSYGVLHTFKGKLKLNLKDPMRLPYVLEDAECLNCK